MKLQITNEQKNPLSGRTEISFKIEGEAITPGRKEVLGLLAAQKGAKDDTLILVHLKQHYGEQSVTGLAHLYPGAETRKRFEHAHLSNRHLKKKEKPGDKQGEDEKEKGGKKEEGTAEGAEKKKEAGKEKEEEPKEEKPEGKKEGPTKEGQKEEKPPSGDKKE